MNDVTVSDPDRVLAMGYAMRVNRGLLSTLFAFDARMAQIVRSARDPVLGQLRLAWWRNQLEQDQQGPTDPLISDILALGGDVSHWSSMVSGWECLLDDMPLSQDVLLRYASGRGGSLFEIAYEEAGLCDNADFMRVGQGWALADFAFRCSDQRTAECALLLSRKSFVALRTVKRVPRLRPLVVLAGLTARDARDGLPRRIPLGAPRRMARAMRYALAGAASAI